MPPRGDLRGGPSTQRGGPKPRPGHELPHNARTARNAARKLDRDNPDGVDPSTIDDPTVRHAYIEHVSRGGKDAEPSSDYEDDKPAPAAPATPSPAPRSSSGVSLSIGSSVGSAILGAFAYALLINVIDGTGQAWLKAKWTNSDGTLP